ncbi:MAG: carbamoyl-phosphate synthase large subunit [Myxococcales bacterium]|nr:carbamoyl-phosphate synthase large subunit [Myxococcales bacterium]
MPKRSDLRSVLLIGSGPIVIGQACEFDYSGTQGAKALREEGLRVILVNSNPATIMTDPELADATYIEPLTVAIVERIIEREKPDALLPTLGGQTALNLALALAERGVLAKHGVELIGASVEAIEKAEDREKFKAAMARIGLEVPRSGYARSMAEARAIQRGIGYPAILRPSFTLGGSGAAIAYHAEQFEERAAWGLAQSPRGEILVEESILGWKEFELEVMRDRADNVVVICSIENFDPMGVHTGDSITVAPALTLTDKEYQRMRDAACAVIREIGVATGGSNIQFAIHPGDGRMMVVEMNPRVSRSSALASKATGFPIARIAAKLAIGYTLDEIPNDITRPRGEGADGQPWQPASFEPTIDYVVVKIPRFAFEKFPGADPTLTTQMKSVGEAMAIGRTFREALQKALRSLETGRFGFDGASEMGLDELRPALATPTADRLHQIACALRLGMAIDEVHAITRVDPWFLDQVRSIVAEEQALVDGSERADPRDLRDLQEVLRRWKRMGFSDRRIAEITGSTEKEIRGKRRALGVKPVYKRVDTCAAEFPAHTPYLYSTYEDECEAAPSDRRKVIILGGGPNRIGQGIEFDYCCVHAALALREEGLETIMVNCNPETVSTDWDISDRLYFEPLTMEDVLAIVETERASGSLAGVIVQFGGQTPLRLAVGLSRSGVKLLGTSADAIDRAEDRERFAALVEQLGLKVPPWGIARSASEVREVAARLGYPVLVRPSYVLGGRAMEVIHDAEGLARWTDRLSEMVAEIGDHPILVDHFLGDAVEVDVDAVSDGRDVVICGVMEHIEEAGIHSGDSACSLPPYTLSPSIIRTIEHQTRALARELEVVGLMNVQFAVKDDEVHVLEVNPRASRTVPFVSKATGVAWAKVAARVMAGRTLASLGVRQVMPAHVAVKEAVFPFKKFIGIDTVLGPEMRSTGEVMGIAADFPTAFAKAQIGAGTVLPSSGTVFLSVRDEDKAAAAEVAERLVALGFAILATHGTAAFLRARGIAARAVNKVRDGSPHCVDAILDGEVALVINTTSDGQAIRDSFSIRRTAVNREVPYVTTVRAARAAAEAIAALATGRLDVCSLQEYHQGRYSSPLEDPSWPT